MNPSESNQSSPSTASSPSLNAAAIDAAYLNLLDAILNLSCSEEACHISSNEFEPLTLL